MKQDKLTLWAFTDASFTQENVGYGIIFVSNKGELYWHGNGYPNTIMGWKGSADGECFAATKAIQEALRKKYEILHLYYDCTTVPQWATKINPDEKNPIHRNLFFATKMAEKKLNIIFHKVKAHQNMGGKSALHNGADTIATAFRMKKPDRHHECGALVKKLKSELPSAIPEFKMEWINRKQKEKKRRQKNVKKELEKANIRAGENKRKKRR